MSKKLQSNSRILESEIEFDDEVIIEGKEINAYISTSYIDLTEKFGLEYEEDSHYNIYLNYKCLEKKMSIDIVKIKDENRKYYKYIPTKEEKTMLIKKLEVYIEKNYNQSIEELIEEIKKEEEAEY